MTSRNEVQIDIEVEGGARAERQFNRAEKGARGLGRSTRGLINPLLGAGLVAGILGGGLLGLGAQSSGSASNSIFRIQGALEGLVGTIFRKCRARHRLLRQTVREAAHCGDNSRCWASGHHSGRDRLGCKVIGSAAGAVGAAVSACDCQGSSPPF